MFREFDLLGCDFKLTFNNDTYKTNLGGLVSICLFISFIILAWYFGQDMYLLKNQKIVLILHIQTLAIMNYFSDLKLILMIA